MNASRAAEADAVQTYTATKSVIGATATPAPRAISSPAATSSTSVTARATATVITAATRITGGIWKGHDGSSRPGVPPTASTSINYERARYCSD